MKMGLESDLIMILMMTTMNEACMQPCIKHNRHAFLNTMESRHHLGTRKAHMYKQSLKKIMMSFSCYVSQFNDSRVT